MGRVLDESGGGHANPSGGGVCRRWGALILFARFRRQRRIVDSNGVFRMAARVELVGDSLATQRSLVRSLGALEQR